MELKKFQELLGRAKQLPSRSQREENIFSVGARGHYENPVSDLLAFFIDPSAAHGMENRVLQALLNCIKQDPDQYIERIDASLIKPPEREGVTNNSKRIDLLLESEKWVMLIENKIYHHLNNPLETYAQWANKKFQGKEVILLVLSIEGAKPERWAGVSWKRFLDELKSVMSNSFSFGELNKWHVLFREYILHLETLVSPIEYSDKEMDFVFSNLNEIKNLVTLRQDVIKSFQEMLRIKLERVFDSKVSSGLETWGGFPALRFSLSKWRFESDLVLCLENSDVRGFHINVHADTDDSKDLISKAEEIMHDSVDQWSEVHNKFRGFRFTLPNHERCTLINELINKMKLLDYYEEQRTVLLTVK